MISTANYPGVPAIFKHVRGDWNCKADSGPICRSMDFESAVESSAVSKFSIYGYQDGTVSISISFGKIKEVNEQFVAFLQAKRIPVSSLDSLSKHVLTKTSESVKIAFRILAENNQIPDSHRKELEAIVEKGDCEPFRTKEMFKDYSYPFHEY